MDLKESDLDINKKPTIKIRKKGKTHNDLICILEFVICSIFLSLGPKVPINRSFQDLRIYENATAKRFSNMGLP